MTIVSIQEVRFEFGKVKRALERGEEIHLTFRNKPLARLCPVKSPPPLQSPDPALEFAAGAEDLPALDNSAIDGAVHG